MSHWLSAAAKVFQRGPIAEQQTYELRCSCGRSIGGVRSETYQQVTCPTCRQRLFVLPASVYPRPRPARPARPKPVPQPAPAEDDEDTLPIEDRAVSRSRPVVSEPAKPRRIFTPVRLVLVSVAAVVALTVWGLNRSRAVQRAEVDYATAVQAGRDALSRKDLVQAGEHFTRALRALDVLGRSDAAARGVRQLSQETSAGNRLLPDKSPEDLLAEAVHARSTLPEAAWQETFQYSYRDAWILFDAPLIRSDGPPGTAWQVEYPLSVGDQRAVISVDFPFLQSLPVQPGPQRVIFAAQLTDLQPPGTTTGPVWKLVLNRESAFLWSNPDVFGLLTGGDVDPETRQVLAAQTNLLQLPPWEAAHGD